MRHLAHHLALAAAFVLVGSAADAAPRKSSKAARAAKARAARAAEAKAEAKLARERMARAREAAEEDDDEATADDDDAPVRSPRLAGKSKRKASRITHARERAQDDEDEDTDSEVAADDEDAPRAKHGTRLHKPARRADDSDDEDSDDSDSDDRVAFASRDPEGDAIGEEIEMPPADATGADGAIKVKHTLGAPHAKKWSVSFGPYAWASAVDASVAVGGASVNTGADFAQMSQHAKFGAEALAEVRYGRFSLSTDLMYGVLGLEGAREVGPVMVTYDGTATSSLVDALGGVTLYGNDHSLFSIEARGGLRYQRTVIKASVGVAGAGLDTPTSVDQGADALAGGRVFVRPTKRLFASAALDTRVFGASNSTWSATADAGLRVGHFQFSLGYRTVTEDRNNTNIRMYGPRLAIQLAF